MKQLIVNADDYGVTEDVSRGILEAHQRGIVTSTSVMIGFPASAEAVRRALTEAPNLGLGVHLTLSGGGRPVLPPSEVVSLVDEQGCFYPFDEWLLRYEQFDPDEIREELAAQCDRFIEIARRPPDHLDGHHHAVYRHAAGLRTLFDLAETYSIPIRNPGLDQGDGPRALLDGIPEHMRETAIDEIVAVLDERHFPLCPVHFEDGFYDTTATLGDLLLILTGLADDGITELMCHPGYVDDTLISDYTTKREAEIQALTHRSAHEVIKAEGITLVTFGALLNV